MSIIDELVVKLKLDLGRFRSDAQNAETELNRVGDASRRTARNMESDGNFMASGFGKVRNQLLSILGLFTAGMGVKNFTQSTIKQADAFGFMSDSIGMSTTRLRAYSDAAERAGGSGEAMTDALKKSAQDVANLKMGIKTLAEVDQGNLLTRWAGAAGLDPSKIFESGESLMQARLKVFETIRKTDKNNPLLHGIDPAVLAATVLEQGGIGAGVTNALKNKGGLEGFNTSVSRQEKVNSVLEGSEELARKARESWFDLTKQFEIIGQKIVISLTPALIKLTEYLKGIKLPSPEVIGKTIDIWIKKFGDLWDKTQKTIDYISEKWGVFSETVKKVTNNGIDLTDGFTVVAAVIGGLVAINVVGWITGIVAALGTLVLAAGSAATALAPLAAVAAAGAAGAYAGNKLYETGTPDQQQKWQDTVGKGIATVAGWMGNEEAGNAVKINNDAADSSKGGGTGIEQIMQTGAGWNVVKKADGSVVKQEGARNWRNNNPGNIEYGTFAKSHGAIGTDGRFAIFPSYETGRKAKSDLIFEGKSYKDKTLTEAIARYAPPSENNTAKYQAAVLAAAGGQNKRMSDYSENERIAIMNAMQKVEGYKAGKTTVMSPPTKNFSVASDEQKSNMPPPIVIPKGDKDINGKVKITSEMPVSSDLYRSMPAVQQTSPRVNPNSINIGSQTFNIKANDTEGIKKELANKMIISEALTQNFNSGMR